MKLRKNMDKEKDGCGAGSEKTDRGVALRCTGYLAASRYWSGSTKGREGAHQSDVCC